MSKPKPTPNDLKSRGVNSQHKPLNMSDPSFRAVQNQRSGQIKKSKEQ